MADLSESIESNAAQPKKAAVDGQSAEQHSLKEQIEADRYLKSGAAVRNRNRGLVITRLKPPGAV